MRQVTDRARELGEVIVQEVRRRALTVARREQTKQIPTWGGKRGVDALAANLLLLTTAPWWPRFHPTGVYEGAPWPKDVEPLDGLQAQLTRHGERCVDLRDAYALAGATVVGDAAMTAFFCRGFGVTLKRGETEEGIGFFGTSLDSTSHQLAVAIIGSMVVGTEIDWSWGLTPERAADLGVSRKLRFVQGFADVPFSAAVLGSM